MSLAFSWLEGAFQSCPLLSAGRGLGANTGARPWADGMAAACHRQLVILPGRTCPRALSLGFWVGAEDLGKGLGAGTFGTIPPIPEAVAHPHARLPTLVRAVCA